MTIQEVLNRLRDIQDQIDEIDPGPDDNLLYDVKDLIYRLIQDVDELNLSQTGDNEWTVES